VVVKAVGGRSGKQVYLADGDAAWSSLTEQLPDGRYVVQPLCGTPGVDIRVFVVGRCVVAAIRRQSGMDGPAGFRANYSMGGSAAPHDLTPSQEALVMRIVEAFAFDYVGIDFLLDGQGAFLFNEIEDAVGSRTLSICTDIDIAERFMAHVLSCLSG
jgi:glutathione synthase/RimK-type ligase-like ATP-grasp enzyme